MAEKYSNYHEHQGEWVIVNTRSSSFMGKLESDSFDTLVLKPSVIGIPKMNITPSGDIKSYNHYLLEKDRTTIIKTDEVQAEEPSSQERADYLLNDWNKKVDKYLKPASK